MNDVDAALAELEERKLSVLNKLRARLCELDAERAELVRAIGQVSPTVARPAIVPHVRSDVGKSVVAIVREAGPSGLSAGNTAASVIQELPGTDRGSVFTHLTRLAGRGTLARTGVKGSYMYTFPMRGPEPVS